MASQNDLLVVARFKDLVTKEVTRITRTFTKFSRTAVKAVGKVARGVGKMTVVLNQGVALVQKMGAGLKKMGGLISIPVSLAAEQERVEAKLEAVLRATGGAAGFAADELFKMADGLQRTTGTAATTTKNAQALLLTFKSIKKEGGVFERAIEASTDLAALLEGDVRQAVLMLGKALEDPAIGVSALREVGVSFSVDQIKVIKTLAETNQLLEAQELVLEGLEGQVRGIAREMRGNFTGAVKALNAEWVSFLETVGKQVTENPRLLAAMEAVISKLREWKRDFFETGELGERVQGFVEMLIDMIPGLIRGVGAMVSGFARFAVVLGNVFSLIGAIFNAIGGLFDALKNVQIMGAELFSKEAQGFLGQLGETFRALAGVGDKGLTIKADDSALMKLIKEMGLIAPQFAEDLASEIEKSFKTIAGKAPEMDIPADKQTSEELSLIERLTKAWKDFGAGWSEAVATRLKELQGLQEEVNKMALEFIDGTQGALVDFLTAIRDETASLGDAFSTLVDTLRTKLSDLLLEFAANRILQGLLEGLSALGGMRFGGPSEEAVATATNTLALNALTATINAQMASMGLDGVAIPTLDDDTIASLEDTIDAAETEKTSIWMGIWDGIKGLGSIFMDVGVFLFNGLMTIVTAIGSLIASGVGTAFDWIAGLFSKGGQVNYLAGGGVPRFIPKGTDTIPAMLTPGEYVLNRAAVQRMGVPALDAINEGRVAGFADGGVVSGSGGMGGVTVNLSVNTIDARGTREFLTSREGRESIVSVIRRGISTQPNFQRQIGRIRKT